jgi:Clp amino terminal domain, pathogenicity island component
MNWLKSFWKALVTPMPASERPAGGTPENFTPRAQQVLALARKEADRLHHNFTGTEHLLLGLVSLGQGTAVNVLRKMGLDLETIRDEIGNIPYTPRVKKVLALAVKEATALNHAFVGTEHILLGLLREGDGVAARVLKNLDVDIEKTRTEILHELGPNAIPAIQRQAETTKAQGDSVDIGRRYDVYCTERNQEVVVYRNALFKTKRSLFKTRQFDTLEFVEIELSDRRTVFVSRFSIIKFCEPGTIPGGEKVSGK